MACRTDLPSGSGFVFCPACGCPYFLGKARSAFEILGFPRTFTLDEAELERRYHDLSRRLHPDRFAAGRRDALAASQRLSALLNRAYLALRTKKDRLDTLVGENTIDREESVAIGENQELRPVGRDTVPADMAEEFFELQEARAEDPVRARAMAQALAAKLDSKRESMIGELYRLASETDWESGNPGPNLERVRELKQELSYLSTMLKNLGFADSPKGACHEW